MGEPVSDAAAGQRVPLALMFAETRGFTRTSEILEASVVLARTREFFSMVTAVVERHDGKVPSVFNDTLVAYFAGPERARHAVGAAQETQREFSPLSDSWERDYNIQAAVSMGIHSGDVVIGSAADGRPLLIGDSVSVAERLLHRARAGEYLMSKDIMDGLVAAKIVLDAEELPPLKIARRDPLRVFGVLLDTRLDFT